MSFSSPNYTQVPNDFFDVFLHGMGLAETKIILAIVRQTMGFHRDSAYMSIDQIAEATGLSRTSVIDGVKDAEKHGHIIVSRDGKANCYELNINQEPTTTTISSPRLPKPVALGYPIKKGKENKDMDKGLSSHPAIKSYRKLTGFYPVKVNMPKVIEALGEKPDFSKMYRFYSAWTGRGYNQRNLAWLEWYVKNEVPGYQKPTKSAPAPTEEY